MQIVYHIGAHCTDDGQIQACLTKNQRLLAKKGINVPTPGRFRPIFRETMKVLQGGPANENIQQIMLDSILSEVDPNRIVFSNDAFICNLVRVLGDDMLYPDIADRSAKLFNLFPDQEVEFCFAIRNPATFLPACFSRIEADSFDAYTAQTDPQNILWSEVISRLRDAVPNAKIKVWSNEDTPFIWNELIAEISGFPNQSRLKGLNDFLGQIMSKEGMDRMQGYLKTHPPANEIQRRRIISAFLDKFEIEEDEYDFESQVWSEDYVNQLTDTYEDDLYTIERMEDVQFICP